jgi:aryl-alcohol dehydrogenase
MQITAAVLRDAAGAYCLESLELGDPGPGEVLVRVHAAGFCHTDLLPRATDLFVRPPVVLGHEGAGVVEAAGPGVTGIPVGAHVSLSFDSCGTCLRCVSGHPAYCSSFFPLNFVGFRADGSSPIEGVAARWFGQSSFATHCIASARGVVVIPDDVPFEIAAPLGCGVQTGAGSVLEALRVRPGGSIAVFGVGGVGLSAVMAAAAVGATTIVAVDINESRLALAREVGATHTVLSGDDAAGQIVGAAGGLLEYSFDTTGLPAVVSTALAILTPGGICGVVGVQQGDLVLDNTAISFGRTLMGILEGDAVPQRTIPALIALWRAGKLPLEKIIKTFPLAEISAAEAGSLSGDVVKPVLIP